MDRVKCLAKIEETIKNGRFKDTWASLSQYETPTWFRDAKFGIFHSLGSIQRSGIWQRVVSAQYVYQRNTRI